MKFNKKLAVAVSGAILFLSSQVALADSTTDIVDALVSKGVLTEEEGALLQKGRTGEKEAAEKKMAEVNELILLINPLLDQPLHIIDEDLSDYESDCDCEGSCRN